LFNQGFEGGFFLMSERDDYLLKRRAKNIKQKELAEYLQVTVSFISKYERGHRDMKETMELKYKKFIDEK